MFILVGPDTLCQMVSEVDKASLPASTGAANNSLGDTPRMGPLNSDESPPKDMSKCREATPKKAPGRRQYSASNRDTPSHWYQGRKGGRGQGRGLGRGRGDFSHSSSGSSSRGASRFSGSFTSNPYHISTCPIPSFPVSTYFAFVSKC